MFEIKDIQFKYEKNDENLLIDTSIQAHKGDIIWLKGENGVGKSTLLKIIAQLIPSNQKFFLDGKLITEREEILSQLIYIPSEPYLFEYLTGRENSEFIQKIFNVEQKKFEEKFDEYSRNFKIDENLGQFVQEYSLGMRHKLYWSSVFSRSIKKIILLDEPFSSMDAYSQQYAKKLLTDLSNEGSIIIFVSHLQEISEELANKLFVLEDGSIKEMKTIYQ